MEVNAVSSGGGRHKERKGERKRSPVGKRDLHITFISLKGLFDVSFLFFFYRYP